MKKYNKNRSLQYKFSIRYKFLAVSTVLLLICVSTYLFMANFVFKADKTQLVYEYNLSTVKIFSSDLQGLLERVEDKLNLIAWAYSQRNIKINSIGEMLSNKSDIISIYESHDYKNVAKTIYQNNKFLSLYELSVNKPQNKTIPFNKILENGIALWNAGGDKKAPLLGFAKSIILKSKSGKPIKQFALISYINVESIMQRLSEQEYSQIEIFNHDGHQLFFTGHSKPINFDILTKAKESKVRFSALKIKKTGNENLVAFAKGFKGQIYVTSKVSSQKAFSAVERFIFRSILFSMIVLTAAFITAIFFSRSLVGPLERLTSGMREVSKGQLNTQIKIKTNDEIEVLANSFNFMIVDLKKSRQELLETNLNLENKVQERTSQLETQNQAVKQAQEALLRTTRLAAVGEIAGQAAHEVLNPLTTIISRLHRMNDRQIKKGYEEVKLLKEISSAWRNDFKQGGFENLINSWTQPSSVRPELKLWDEDLSNLNEIEQNLEKQISNIKSDTKFILKESQRINKIIQSMRSMSIVHAEKNQFQLHELVEEGINIMADLMDKLKVKMNIQLSDKKVDVYLDSDEFIQAFTNLIRNSIQAINFRSKKDSNFEPIIEVEIFNVDNEVEIHIKDNGVGISVENKKKLFENQFTTKSKEEGTGLGLSISRRFIRAFGGDIYLYSTKVSEGSTFVIRLPLYKENIGEIA